jgi:hypothetical protein
VLAGAGVGAAGALVAAGAAAAAGVLVAGAVVAAFFFVALLGAVGAASGSWYCWSPAPSANAAAGVIASSAATQSDVSARRGIASLVADGPALPVVTLPRWPRPAGWR